MKQWTPEFRSERMAWRFRKSGADGDYAKQFVSFEESVRNQLRRLAQIQHAELPAVACYFDDMNWVMITDRQLIWSSQGERTAISVDEIEDATVEPKSLVNSGTKKNLTELTILSKDGQRYQIHIEAGYPFSGFWNTIKMVASWNRQ